MPFYKFLGNKILTFYQNKLFNKKFTEFHSGYRIYKVQSLKKIPYEMNNNDHSFDNQIIIQFLLANLNIKELPIPTYYGDEISYVNGLKYAFQVFTSNLRAKLQTFGIFYDKKYDLNDGDKVNYVLKDNFDSPHSRTLKNITKDSKVLDLGCNDLSVSEILKNKNCIVTAVDKNENLNHQNSVDKYYQFDLDNGLPEMNYDDLDFILLLDVIEHLKDPESFMTELKRKTDKNSKVRIIISTPNIGFVIIRFMLLFGSFNYGKRGILDKTHTRLFTFSSFKNLITQSGFRLIKASGIPAPLPLVLETIFWKLFNENKSIFNFVVKKYIFIPNLL